MSTTENSEHHHHHHEHHEHHHHHHKMDGASRFKRNSLAAIERRKTITKWTFRIMEVIAVALVITIILLILFDR